MGQSVTLSCISHGGNPLAQIFWYKKDGDRWREVDMSYNTYGRESRNSFTFLASPSHNQAKFRCEAKNEMNLSPMTTEIVLSVQCKQNVYNFVQSAMSKYCSKIYDATAVQTPKIYQPPMLVLITTQSVLSRTFYEIFGLEI